MSSNAKTFPHLSGVLLAAGIVLLVALDQFCKYLAQLFLKEKPSISLIRNVLELKYLYPENRGIAFGMFQGHVSAFIVLSLFFFAAILYVWLRIPRTKYYLPLMITMSLMLSGALGNFIDRVFRGYVIDFIYFSLIDFPIFNLADVYVVSSGGLLVFFVGFRYKEEDFAFLSPRK